MIGGAGLPAGERCATGTGPEPGHGANAAPPADGQKHAGRTARAKICEPRPASPVRSGATDRAGSFSNVPSRRQTRPTVKRVSQATVVLALLIAVGGYIAVRHSVPVLEPSSCTAVPAGTAVQPVSLNVDQAGIAATIAAVAQRDKLPSRAVTIAYATALQESKLTNLRSGDLDSVGVFQQRPSEGWGPTRRLEDPVYATTKFFAALIKVPAYQTIPVYRAAQSVQRSADGYAYNQYATVAARMSAAFTGQLPHAVWCWYPGLTARPRLAAASSALTQAFGPMHVSPYADPTMAVRVPAPAAGWAVAAWLVSHADTFGIRRVAYQGYQWLTGHGTSGWTRIAGTRQPQPPPAAVVFG
jgi:hypothetical protein